MDEKEEKLIKGLKALSSVKAPADFSEKVMDRLERKVGKRRLAKKLFYPWPIKIPLEVAATVLVGFLIVRAWVEQPEQKFQKMPTILESTKDTQPVVPERLNLAQGNLEEAKPMAPQPAMPRLEEESDLKVSASGTDQYSFSVPSPVAQELVGEEDTTSPWQALRPVDGLKSLSSGYAPDSFRREEGLSVGELKASRARDFEHRKIWSWVVADPHQAMMDLEAFLKGEGMTVRHEGPRTRTIFIKEGQIPKLMAWLQARGIVSDAKSTASHQTTETLDITLILEVMPDQKPADDPSS